jgi:hypothetical protein
MLYGRLGGDGREPLCTDEEIPGLNARGRDLIRCLPRVVGEPSAYVGTAGSLCDEENPDSIVFGAGQRTSEHDYAFVGEPVHEFGVVGHAGLVEGSFAVDPCPACFASDRVKGHPAVPLDSP